MAAALPLNRRRRRRERVFRVRKGFEDLTEDEIINRYRLPRQAITELSNQLGDRLRSGTNRSSPIPVLTKVLVCLRYLAKGDFLSEVGDLHGISRSSASCIITEVIEAINAVVLNIRFPHGRDTVIVKQGFFNRCGIPNVVGAIDGTLIPIQAPSDHPEVYICRKGYAAINVQAVVDHTGRFRDVCARWPGSTHDASIFDNSRLKAFLQHHHPGHLLGDSGYPLKEYLLTPIQRPNTEPERRYNSAHIAGRTVVERSFGQLKSRFRCIHKSGGGLLSKPVKCCNVIVACMRLHNLCQDLGLAALDDEEEMELEAGQDEPQGDVEAIGHRQAIVQLFA